MRKQNNFHYAETYFHDSFAVKQKIEQQQIPVLVLMAANICMVLPLFYGKDHLIIVMVDRYLFSHTFDLRKGFE